MSLSRLSKMLEIPLILCKFSRAALEMYLEMCLDKHHIECAKGLLKQDRLDVVSGDPARTLVQWSSRGQEHVDEDDDLDDKLGGDDVVWKR